MLKKLGIPVLALGAIMVLIPPPRASAAVRFGVFIGGPVYGYPAYPAPPPPPVYYNAYPAYPVYPYAGAAYVYAYRHGYSYRNRPYWRGREYRGYREHYRNEWRDSRGRWRR